MAGRVPGNKKGGARRNENNKIYAHPLPLLLSEPEHTTLAHKFCTSLGFSSVRVLNPHCEGILDIPTRSVWVMDTNHAKILWTRGFFGKGDLSRSEPSWYTRQLNSRQIVGKHMTSEEIREKRRAERKQFKLDRAKALAEAAAEAEAAFREGRQAALPAVPSGATWKPEIPAPASDPIPPDLPEANEELDGDHLLDVEHLQLTLQEAFFLCWSLDCLTILDSSTREPMTLRQVWTTFKRTASVVSPNPSLPATTQGELRFDNPFLLSYVVYHYYRSHGWVVKSGTKFCVDLLLYKRGPVFHHAEFAVVVIPVYENPADQQSSPFALASAVPFSWSWLSTINRVNSQVQKTLILAYVTVPSSTRVLPHCSSSPACLAQYSVREVILRRFIPARMRD